MTIKTKVNGHGVRIALSIIVLFMVIGGYLLSATVGNHDHSAISHLDIRTDITENRRDISEVKKTLNAILQNQAAMMSKLEALSD